MSTLVTGAGLVGTSFAQQALARGEKIVFVDPEPRADFLRLKLGERGHTLSGGERQRVSIARAVLKNPRILILDEATSSVDTETERKIEEAMQRLVQGRTVFAIAHRLSTLRSFDRIMVLKDGRILQEGAPDRLQQQDGPYRDLVDLELSRFQRVPQAA
jgi:ATP-binding cassette subfamily B protein